MLFKNDDTEKKQGGKGFYIALIACALVLGTLAIYGAVSAYKPNNIVAQDPTGVNPGNVTPTKSVEIIPDEPDDSVDVGKPQKTPVPTIPPKNTPTTMPTPTKSPETPTSKMYIMPVSGKVINNYSAAELAFSTTMQDWRVHNGIDIAASVGTKVVAFTSGTVKDIYLDDLLGQCIVIEHSGDLTSLYGNLQEAVPVSVGDKVSAGDTIGGVGETAWTEVGEETHMHFELYAKGTPKDPMTYFEK